MKKVISISLGSSKRDHTAVHDFGGHTFQIERRGTDGDKQQAINLIRELDGKVDAFGLGVLIYISMPATTLHIPGVGTNRRRCSNYPYSRRQRYKKYPGATGNPLSRN